MKKSCEDVKEKGFKKHGSVTPVQSQHPETEWREWDKERERGRETVTYCDKVDMNQRLFLYAGTFSTQKHHLRGTFPLTSKKSLLKRDIEWWWRWPCSTHYCGSRRSDSAHKHDSSRWKQEMKNKNKVQWVLFYYYYCYYYTKIPIKAENNIWQLVPKAKSYFAFCEFE